LNDIKFEEEYTTSLDHIHEMSLSWIALLFVVLSLGVTTMQDNNPLLSDIGRQNEGNVSKLSNRYRSAALQCLSADGFFWRYNIHTLQALILLIYAINHSQGSALPLLGTAYNIALGLGCHVDPDQFGLEPADCEERRRLWAALMMLHTIQNVSLGSYDLNIKSDVKMPADVDDVDIGKSPVPNRPTQMSYLLFKFRLYELTARICRKALVESPQITDIWDLDNEIQSEQWIWETKYMSDMMTESLPLHHQVQLYILQGYANQLTLLLHRPLFHSSKHENSRIRCMKAAKDMLELHETMFNTASFLPYRWYINGLGSFYAFHACVVLIAVLEDTSQDDHDLIRDSLQRCLARFKSSCENSAICRQAGTILGELLYVLTKNM
jgi:hypothetical protein